MNHNTRLLFFKCCSIILLFMVGLSACTTYPVQSEHITREVSLVDGFSYYLPTQNLKIDVTGTPIKKAELEKKIKNVKQSISTISAKKTELAKSVQALTAVVSKLPDGSDAKKTQQAKLDIEKAKLAIQTTALSSKQSELEDLEAQFLLAVSGKCVRNYVVNLTQLPPEPDTRFHMALNLDHSAASSDDFVIETGANGLLSNTKIERDDQFGAILIELAGALSIKSIDPNAADSLKEESCTQYKYQKIVNPLYAGNEIDVPETNISISVGGERQAKYTKKERIDIKLMGTEVYNSQQESRRSAVVKVDGQEILNSVSDSDKEIQIELRGVEEYQGDSDFRDIELTIDDVSVVQENDRKDVLDCSGLYYRRNMPYQFVVKRAGHPIAAQSMLFPTGPISCLSLPASRFVKTVHEARFVNGILTKWDTERPSEALAFVKIPVNVAKAILSVPAELIKLKVDISNQNKSLSDAEKAEIEAYQALLKLREQIEAGTYDPDGAN